MMTISKSQDTLAIDEIIQINMAEWERATPDSHPALKSFSFQNDLSARKIADQLTRSGKIELLEMVNGLHIRSTSYVGSIQFGHLQLNIQPKIDAKQLLNLLRYAYGLRDIQLFSKLNFSPKEFAFQDILIYQLILEVEELLVRGLIRQYRKMNTHMMSPAGRINFQQLVRQGGLQESGLPCIPHYRLENCAHNQLVSAGLRKSAWMTNDLELRARARKLSRLFTDTVDQVVVDQNIMTQVDRESNRQSNSYIPAITLIKLLFKDQGIEYGDIDEPVLINGYLFDMNLFFQAMIGRFLRENLLGVKVEDQHKLKGLLSYEPNYKLPYRSDPIPRPDFAVIKNSKVISLLDTKYRNLWKEGLPRDMLYQLVVYALAQNNAKKSVIIYPTTDPLAKEARIRVNDPNQGNQIGRVILKPINLNSFEKYIRENNKKELETLGNWLVN